MESGIRKRKGLWSFLQRNALFKKRASHLVNYQSGPSRTLVDYCLVRINQRNLLKDIKSLSSEECIGM